jgi:putative transcriptional regulator
VSDSRPIPAEPDRLREALLATHAAGTLSEPFAVLVASHLQMKAGNRASVAATADPAQPPWPRQPVAALDQMYALMPLALRHYVRRHVGGVLVWRTLLPGLQQCRIMRDAQADASFVRCRPGKAIPAHAHEGLEAVLVLQGGFRDGNRHYAPGDIAVADDTIEHRPVADRAAECIIFVVLGAPVKLTGPFGRLIQRIFRR